MKLLIMKSSPSLCYSLLGPNNNLSPPPCSRKIFQPKLDEYEIPGLKHQNSTTKCPSESIKEKRRTKKCVETPGGDIVY
jgi:hypothetical protein